jgi:hypothetical protein
VWPRRFVANIGGSGEDYFREFLGFEPEWQTSHPDLKSMLMHADAALIIGDPAMKIRAINFVFSIWQRYGTSSPASDSCLPCGWREGKRRKDWLCGFCGCAR